MKKAKNILIITFIILISSFIPGIEAGSSTEEIWTIQLKEGIKPGQEPKILRETNNPEKKYVEVKDYLILDDGRTLILSHKAQDSKNIKIDKDYKVLSKKNLKAQKVKIGDSQEELIYSRGVPSRVDSHKKHSWYSYINDDFTDYSLYYMEDGKIKNIYLSREKLLDKHGIDRNMNKLEVEKKFKDKKIKGKNIENEFLIDNLNHKFIYDPFDKNKVLGVMISDPKYRNPKIEMEAEILGIYEKQILDLTNLYRAKNKKTILKHNEELQKLAIQYSKYMADNNHFDHYDKEGRNVAGRLKEFTNLNFYLAVENLAYGYRTPVGVMEGWIHSEQHRMGMLHDLAEEMGIGIQLNGKTPYYTSIFFKSKESARKQANNQASK